MRARALLPLLVAVLGCDRSSSDRAAPRVANQPLSVDVMRAMLAPGEACFQKYGRDMPPRYMVQAWVGQSSEGFLQLELRSGDRVAFNECIVGAIRAARIHVQLAEPVEVPLAFDFTGRT